MLKTNAHVNAQLCERHKLYEYVNVRKCVRSCFIWIGQLWLCPLPAPVTFFWCAFSGPLAHQTFRCKTACSPWSEKFCPFCSFWIRSCCCLQLIIFLTNSFFQIYSAASRCYIQIFSKLPFSNSKLSRYQWALQATLSFFAESHWRCCHFCTLLSSIKAITNLPVKQRIGQLHGSVDRQRMRAWES